MAEENHLRCHSAANTSITPSYVESSTLNNTSFIKDSEINVPSSSSESKVPNISHQPTSREDVPKNCPPFRASSSWPLPRSKFPVNFRNDPKYLDTNNDYKDKQNCLACKEASNLKQSEFPMCSSSYNEKEIDEYINKLWQDYSLGNFSLETESLDSLPTNDNPLCLKHSVSKDNKNQQTTDKIDHSAAKNNCEHNKCCCSCSSGKQFANDSTKSIAQSDLTRENNCEPHPSANTPNTKAQGETQKRPALLIRSKIELDPVAEINLIPHQHKEKQFGSLSNPNSHTRSTKANNNQSKKPTPFYCHVPSVSDVPTSIIEPSKWRTHSSRVCHGRNQQQGAPAMASASASRSTALGCIQPLEQTQPRHQEFEIEKLKQELDRVQKQIMWLSSQMEGNSRNASSYLGERRGDHSEPSLFAPSAPYRLLSPPHGNPSFHEPLSRRATWQPPNYHEGSSSNTMERPWSLQSLQDRIVALQMQNAELSLFLQKETAMRRQAQQQAEKEAEVAHRLQRSLQDISTSTLIMDPASYQQIAETYIASRKTPIRRTHTCNPYFGYSDLVCDRDRLQISKNLQQQSNSCPSSPGRLSHERKSAASSAAIGESPSDAPSLPQSEGISPMRPVQFSQHHGRNAWPRKTENSPQANTEKGNFYKRDIHPPQI